MDLKETNIDEENLTMKSLFKFMQTMNESLLTLKTEIQGIRADVTQINDNVVTLDNENLARANEIKLLNKQGKGALLMTASEDENSSNLINSSNNNTKKEQENKDYKYDKFDNSENHPYEKPNHSSQVKKETEIDDVLSEINSKVKYLFEMNKQFNDNTSYKNNAKIQHLDIHNRGKIAPTAPYLSRTSSPSPDRSIDHFESHSIRLILLNPDKVIGTVEVLRGNNDIGIEDFIKAVKKAKSRCNLPDLLLDLIIADKIKDNAKESIRYIEIDSYETLFKELRKNVGIKSVTDCRKKLSEVRQTNNETVQSYTTRFRKAFNELKYAIQSEHKSTVERKVMLQDAEKIALDTYVDNLLSELNYPVAARNPTTMNDAEQLAAKNEDRINRTRQLTRVTPQTLGTGNNKILSKQNNLRNPFNKTNSYSFNKRPNFYSQSTSNTSSKINDNNPNIKLNQPINITARSQPNFTKSFENPNIKFNSNYRPSGQNFQFNRNHHRPPGNNNRVHYVQETEANRISETLDLDPELLEEEENLNAEIEYSQYQENYYMSEYDSEVPEGPANS